MSESLFSTWEFGPCEGGMRGCGWAQRGSEHETWTHFGSVAEAEAFAASQNALPPLDPANVVDALWVIEKIEAVDGDYEEAFREVKALVYALRRAVEIGHPEAARAE
jgi:hypothetical protein